MTAAIERPSIVDLEARGISLTAAEAIAVVQTLLATGVRGTAPHRPVGPPSPATVLIAADGSVVLRGYAMTPIVLEIATLLYQLLPPGKARMPGALRYTIARGMHQVLAPPFDSLDDFSRALARFETRERTEIVRALFARAAMPIEPAQRGIFRTIGLPVGATVLAGILLIGTGTAMHNSRQSAVDSRRSTVDSRPATANRRQTVENREPPERTGSRQGTRALPAASGRTP